ncbi:MAG TPA: GGDEF domain-containing protein [Gammaproteobacteria bacterium]|nr:GGDEF domain-containing protein [Gammaproteobacteria bacterium]
MEIRNTAFWGDIESLFTPHETGVPQALQGCSLPVLMARSEHALSRSERNSRSVMFMAISFHVQPGRTAVAEEVPLRRLCQVALRALRSCDSVHWRADGSALVLLEDIREPEQAAIVLGKLQTALAHLSRGVRKRPHISLCAGVAFYPGERNTATALWNLASIRMQRALDRMDAEQATPSDLYVVSGNVALEQDMVIKDLHHIYRNGGFRVLYQPVFDMVPDRPVAFEALLRVSHDQMGLLRPRLFMELLDDSGLIVPVGEEVLFDACRFARRRLDEGHPPARVCVNVSGRQVEDSGFLVSVLDALYETAIEPGLLQLEFAEALMVHHAGRLGELLPELHKAGVGLAVDRFGRAGSSLVDLVRFPVSRIKLDYALVESVAQCSVAQKVVSGTVAFAHNTGMEVAAVGVETEAQQQYLAQAGCSEIQGFGLAAPEPDGAFLGTAPSG